MAQARSRGYSGAMGAAETKASDPVTIYEVLNETRGELYVGWTWRLHDLDDFKSMTKPKAVRHWNSSDTLRFKPLEKGIPRADAAAFITSYRESDLVKAWKVLSDT
jgi:hypothetical protein